MLSDHFSYIRLVTSYVLERAAALPLSEALRYGVLEWPAPLATRQEFGKGNFRSHPSYRPQKLTGVIRAGNKLFSDCVDK